VWKGPEIGGITTSQLSQFIVCRERFRMRMLLGLKESEDYQEKMEYGNLWHAAMEAHALGQDWKQAINREASNQFSNWPSATKTINRLVTCCHAQVELWIRMLPSFNQTHWVRRTLHAEYEFAEYYTLPSGRRILMRGKMDGFEGWPRKHGQSIILREYKTRGDKETEDTTDYLHRDLQVNFYLMALPAVIKRLSLHGNPVAIRYILVQRPNGARNAVRLRQKETESQFTHRIVRKMLQEPDDQFSLIYHGITPDLTNKFQSECLHPVLEQLCDWWDEQCSPPADGRLRHHWLTPFGIYNPLAEGRRGGYFHALTKDFSHLTFDPILSPELKHARPAQS
jgi:hypothetical protein